ncbi:hypothetical protein BOW53_02935 [Solemya pervernicosa gill symbiont]|uniref:Terminase n=1 Tax=Solemya pervernicosa gill symbiont TaxID=642797 RepID=A0A1T2L965_9GAMM|nr:hypothetical protein [Solemya pervernicosa gill symbiont]OOZ41649.1 hypothetical protein BOW53_02935 [Solemya pervernicosa gill symbiont]
MNATPSDVIRTVSQEELPPSVREIPAGHNPMADGLLMLHQVDWIKLCHAHDLAIAEKGRRTGITFASALDGAITAASIKSAGGDNVYYVGDTKEKGLEFIGYCAHMAKVMASAMGKGWNGIEVFLFEDQQPDGSSKQITAYRIRYATGFQIVALSSNPANIRGLQGIVVIDEAAFHQNVQAVIDAATALIIWGGKIRIISTHNGAGNPFNQLIKDSRAGLNDFRVYFVSFDNAVANGLYERVCFMKGWEYSRENEQAWYDKVRNSYTNKAAMLEELDAVPREGSGVAIPGILVENAMPEERPILRLTLDNDFVAQGEAYKRSWCEEWINDRLTDLLTALNPKQQHHYGSDYARHADFAVVAPIVTRQNLDRSVPFTIEMHNVPTRQQEQILWHMIDHLPRFGGGFMDATGSGATLAEYTADKYGRPLINEVMLNDKWYRENMGKVQNAFEDGVIEIPRDADIKNDLRQLQLINGIIKLPGLRTSDTKNAAFKRHGDSAIAIAMAYLASLSDVESYAYHSATNPRRSNKADDLQRTVRTTAGFGRRRGGVM